MQLRLILRIAALATFLISLQPFAAAHQAATNAAQPGHLTVDRIYSQPSLSGRLTRGIAWSPDGKRLTYLDAKGSGKDAKTELWSLYAASGERSVLISADKLENIFPAPPSKQSQATGAGRHAPSQYQWSPNGEALLFEGTNAVAWFDLKSQSGRVLVSGKEDLSDIKISPDSKYVSFVRDHNLWIVSTADGKERAVTTGGSEVLRKGEVDWVYSEELDIYSGYWWSPDSSAIAYLEMDESKVSQFSLLNFESYTGEAELQRYPVAGGQNPTVRILVASLSGGEPRLIDTGTKPTCIFPALTGSRIRAASPSSDSIAIKMSSNSFSPTRPRENLHAAHGKRSILDQHQRRFALLQGQQTFPLVQRTRRLPPSLSIRPRWKRNCPTHKRRLGSQPRRSR